MVFKNVSMNSLPSVIPSSFCFSTFLLCKLNVDRIPVKRLSDGNFSGCERSMFVNNVSNWWRELINQTIQVRWNVKKASNMNKMLLILLYLLNVAILLAGGCFWMSKSQCIAAWSDMNDDVHTEWRNVDSRGVITRSNVCPLVCVGSVTCWAKLRLA